MTCPPGSPHTARRPRKEGSFRGRRVFVYVPDGVRRVSARLYPARQGLPPCTRSMIQEDSVTVMSEKTMRPAGR